MSVRQLIAVVGSATPGRIYDPPMPDVEGAAAAAREVGEALARAGYDLLAFSTRGSFIESEVIGGYSAAGVPGRIELRVTDSAQVQLPPMPPEITVDVRADVASNWEIPFFRAILAADGVILIGGGRSIRVTGTIAAAQRIPLVALAMFGGGAKQVRQQLPGSSASTDDDDVALMASPWRPGTAERVIASLAAQSERKKQEAADTRHRLGAGARRWTGFAAVLLLLAAGAALLLPPAGAVQAGPRSLVAVIGGPLLAAVAGALMRNLGREPDETVPAVALGLGAGFVTVLLYLATQLLTTPDLLAALDARRLMLIVLPLGFVSGLTTDLIYARLRRTELLDTALLTPGGSS